MTKLRQLYRCNVCGNVVEITNEGAPDLHCCGEPMNELDAKTQDAGSEKHVPVVEEISGGVNVKVGSVDHPMEEKHYIKFIEVMTKDKVMRAELKPAQKPAAFFPVKKQDITAVREFCTVHMLWKA